MAELRWGMVNGQLGTLRVRPNHTFLLLRHPTLLTDFFDRGTRSRFLLSDSQSVLYFYITGYDVELTS